MTDCLAFRHMIMLAKLGQSAADSYIQLPQERGPTYFLQLGDEVQSLFVVTERQLRHRGRGELEMCDCNCMKRRRRLRAQSSEEGN